MLQYFWLNIFQSIRFNSARSWTVRLRIILLKIIVIDSDVVIGPIHIKLIHQRWSHITIVLVYRPIRGLLIHLINRLIQPLFNKILIPNQAYVGAWRLGWFEVPLVTHFAKTLVTSLDFGLNHIHRLRSYSSALLGLGKITCGRGVLVNIVLDVANWRHPFPPCVFLSLNCFCPAISW